MLELSPLDEGVVHVESEVFIIVSVAPKQERAVISVERIGLKPNDTKCCRYYDANCKQLTDVKLWKLIFI